MLLNEATICASPSENIDNLISKGDLSKIKKSLFLLILEEIPQTRVKFLIVPFNSY